MKLLSDNDDSFTEYVFEWLDLLPFKDVCSKMIRSKALTGISSRLAHPLVLFRLSSGRLSVWVWKQKWRTSYNFFRSAGEIRKVFYWQVHVKVAEDDVSVLFQSKLDKLLQQFGLLSIPTKRKNIVPLP